MLQNGIKINSTPAQRGSFYAEFGTAMRILRKQQNISLEHIANKMHVPVDVIRGYESGKQIPLVDALVIYKFLGMNIIV